MPSRVEQSERRAQRACPATEAERGHGHDARHGLGSVLFLAGADLKIRRDPKLGTYVQGLSDHELTSPEGLTQLIEDGNKKRAVASTLMNSESSRSHAVVIIKLEQETKGEGAKIKKSSKINLVDLAGSERASKTGASGDTLKEAISINQSLSALGNVINALTDPKFKGHIPYRSSKLTHLLEESLGGGAAGRAWPARAAPHEAVASWPRGRLHGPCWPLQRTWPKLPRLDPQATRTP